MSENNECRIEENSDGRGSTPLRTKPANPTCDQTDLTTASCPLRVFLADDSVCVRELMVELLTEFPEIEIVGQTDDALKATDLIEKAQPDIVILDLKLRRGNGLGVLGNIKRKLPSTIVMIMSGQPNPSYQQMSQQMGADYYFRKSDGFEGLMQVLSRLRPHETRVQNGS